MRGSKTGKDFPKNKVVTDKSPLFVIGRFVVAILFVLTLVSDRAVLNIKGCVFNLSGFNYKTILQFFEREFPFPENLYQG